MGETGGEFTQHALLAAYVLTLDHLRINRSVSLQSTKEQIMLLFRNNVFRTVVSLTVVFATAQFAAAQRGRGGMSRTVSDVRLATLEQVQGELKLNDDQKEKASEINDKLRNDRRALFQGGDGDVAARRKELDKLSQDASATFATVLEESQLQRLREIFVQVNGGSALSNDLVAKELKITDEQKNTLEEVRSTSAQSFRDAFQNLRDVSAEQRREAFVKMRSEHNEKLLEVLTNEQRKQFEKMKGESIEIDMSQLRGRRRRN